MDGHEHGDGIARMATTTQSSADTPVVTSGDVDAGGDEDGDEAADGRGWERG